MSFAQHVRPLEKCICIAGLFSREFMQKHPLFLSHCNRTAWGYLSQTGAQLRVLLNTSRRFLFIVSWSRIVTIIHWRSSASITSENETSFLGLWCTFLNSRVNFVSFEVIVTKSDSNIDWSMGKNTITTEQHENSPPTRSSVPPKFHCWIVILELLLQFLS